MREVVFTQEAIPHYRVELFDKLASLLGEKHVKLSVWYEGSNPMNANGLDAYSWAESTRCQRFRIGSRVFVRRPGLRRRGPAAVVTELAAGNVNAWSSLVRGAPVILFGHGANYVNEGSRLADTVEWILSLGAARVVTYMPSGKRIIESRPGVSPSKVTTMFNSTDTEAIRKWSSSLSQLDLHEFRLKIGVPPDARVAAYIGALEPYKNIDLLLESASLAFERDKNVFLLIGGTGSQRPLVDAFAEANRGRCAIISHVDRRVWAILGRIGEVVIVPGRIGLIAVDALAAGLPILTTEYPYHAPEVEYLTDRGSLTCCKPAPSNLAREWTETRWRKIVDKDIPTIEKSAVALSRAVLSVI